MEVQARLRELPVIPAIVVRLENAFEKRLDFSLPLG